MRFIDAIYRIIDMHDDGNQSAASIELLADCDIYRGHFPGNPITPGVVMIGIARELIELKLRKKLELVGVPSIKYTNVLIPTATPSVTYLIDTKPSDSGISAKVVVKDTAIIYAKMNLKLSYANA
ncbi:MAG: hypothetical protein NC082_04355 [Clostridiales bacterium]|nr:hypothetical protein [Clostridiales bacterium]